MTTHYQNILIKTLLSVFISSITVNYIIQPGIWSPGYSIRESLQVIINLCPSLSLIIGQRQTAVIGNDSTEIGKVINL